MGSGFRFATSNQVWSQQSLVQAMALVVSNSLIHTGHISNTCRASGGDRGGGWLRMHLTNSTEEESKIFSEALQEVLGLWKSRATLFLDIHASSQTIG